MIREWSRADLPRDTILLAVAEKVDRSKQAEIAWLNFPNCQFLLISWILEAAQSRNCCAFLRWPSQGKNSVKNAKKTQTGKPRSFFRENYISEI